VRGGAGIAAHLPAGAEPRPNPGAPYRRNGQLKSASYEGERTAAGLVEWTMNKARAAALARIGAKASGSSSGGQKQRASDGPADFYPASSGVISLDGDGYDAMLRSKEPYFVEFYAPWCGHCQALKPEFTQVASALAGRVKVAAVDCEAHKSVCADEGVQGYPTLKLFLANKSRPKGYKLERAAPAMTEWVLAEAADFILPPEVHEVTSNGVFARECLGEGGAGKPRLLCIVAFLPPMFSSSAMARNAMVDGLGEVAKRFVSWDIAYFWAQSGDHPAVQAQLGMDGPGVVGIAPGKAAFSDFYGAVRADSLADFVGGLTRGRSGLKELAGGSLREFEAVDPWDGKDYVWDWDDEDDEDFGDL